MMGLEPTYIVAEVNDLLSSRRTKPNTRKNNYHCSTLLVLYFVKIRVDQTTTPLEAQYLHISRGSAVFSQTNDCSN